jgi:hypothetical protein
MGGSASSQPQRNPQWVNGDENYQKCYRVVHRGEVGVCETKYLKSPIKGRALLWSAWTTDGEYVPLTTLHITIPAKEGVFIVRPENHTIVQRPNYYVQEWRTNSFTVEKITSAYDKELPYVESDVRKVQNLYPLEDVKSAMSKDDSKMSVICGDYGKFHFEPQKSYDTTLTLNTNVIYGEGLQFSHPIS